MEGFYQKVPPEVQLLGGFELTLQPVTSGVIFLFHWRYLFKFTSALNCSLCVCVCLSGTRLSPMNSLLQKSQKMTKSECPSRQSQADAKGNLYVPGERL